MAPIFSDQPVLSTVASPVRTPASLRGFAAVIAAICWGALALQLDLILRRVGARGLPAIDGVVVFLMFFTTQINLLVALVTTCTAAGLSWLLRRDGLKTALAVYMATGGLVFALWLRPYYHHRNLQLTADILLHYVTPPLYLLFWLIAVPKPALRWRDPVLWVIYPAIYIVTALLFGEWTGFYFYPIVNISRLGFWPVAINVLLMGLSFLAVGLIVVALVRQFHPAPRRDD